MHPQELQVNICLYKCLKGRHALMKFAASMGAGAQCKSAIHDRPYLNQSALGSNHFRFIGRFRVECACTHSCVCVFQCRSQSIPLISLLLYSSERLDTWASARLTSAEREEVFGEKDQRPPFCLLPSKSRLKNSPSVSSAAQNFKTKREKRALPSPSHTPAGPRYFSPHDSLHETELCSLCQLDLTTLRTRGYRGLLHRHSSLKFIRGFSVCCWNYSRWFIIRRIMSEME